MQTLQNVGSLTASLAPIAGGYGYAGADQDVALTGSGEKFAPVTGGIGSMYSSVGTGTGATNNPATVNPFVGMNPQQPGIGQV